MLNFKFKMYLHRPRHVPLPRAPDLRDVDGAHAVDQVRKRHRPRGAASHDGRQTSADSQADGHACIQTGRQAHLQTCMQMGSAQAAVLVHVRTGVWHTCMQGAKQAVSRACMCARLADIHASVSAEHATTDSAVRTLGAELSLCREEMSGMRAIVRAKDRIGCGATSK